MTTMQSAYVSRATLAALVFLCAIPLAAGDIEVRPVKFSPGKSSATVTGTLRGDQTIDYTLDAKGGQTMTVKMKGSNASNYFNVLPPASETALFVGSTSGNTWTGTLPGDGTYTIRVYLMRSAARRNEKSNYTLDLAVTGSPVSGGDAKVPGTPYHATGIAPCSTGTGTYQCEFGVIRGTPGNAEVHITSPGGIKRVLLFKGSSVTAADPKVKLKASKLEYEWYITIDDVEHYRIGESAIVGG
jgi:hypothetical protein